MRVLLIATILWSGEVMALDLPPPAANAVVEKEVCNTQIEAEILQSDRTAFSRDNTPAHFEVVRCTWHLGGTEFVVKDGVRAGPATARLISSMRRTVERQGSSENEVVEADIIAFEHGTQKGRFSNREVSVYHIANGTKTLKVRTIDGEPTNFSETIEEAIAGPLRIVITTTRGPAVKRFNNLGDKANIIFEQRVCQFTRINTCCPITPTG